MAKKLLHCCIGVRMHESICISAESMHAFTGVVRTMNVQVCMLDRCGLHICFTLATGCAYARMYVQFVSFPIGK